MKLGLEVINTFFSTFEHQDHAAPLHRRVTGRAFLSTVSQSFCMPRNVPVGQAVYLHLQMLCICPLLSIIFLEASIHISN